MKPMGVISSTALFLLLGFSVPADARQDKQENPQKQDQPAKPPKQAPQAKPQQQQQHAQQQAKGQQDQQQKQQHQQQQQSRIVQQQQRTEQQPHVQQVKMQSSQEQHRQEGEQQGVWQDRRAHNWQSEHRDWQQRGGYNGYRIPDDRYNGYFGPSHAFRIYSYPVSVVGGYPRFQYGGFSFSVVDPWPEYWSNNWYVNDDVYVDYSGNGYYMYNRRYPRDRIAISVYAPQGEEVGVWQQHRALNWQSEHRDWQQRGGYNGYRIPDDRYPGYFGPDHVFRMSSYPITMVGGYPRFQYGGFSFSVVDPWPEYWSNNWYDNDDLYIDYSGDGYYLYNRRYPQDRIAINAYVN
jgi:hypothetical protein